MSTEPTNDIPDADGHLQVAAERAVESKPSISDSHDDDPLDELVKDDTPSRVRDGLWIGSLEAARNYPHLRSQNITHVLQVPASPSPVAVHPTKLQVQTSLQLVRVARWVVASVQTMHMHTSLHCPVLTR